MSKNAGYRRHKSLDRQNISEKSYVRPSMVRRRDLCIYVSENSSLSICQRSRSACARYSVTPANITCDHRLTARQTAWLKCILPPSTRRHKTYGISTANISSFFARLSKTKHVYYTTTCRPMRWNKAKSFQSVIWKNFCKDILLSLQKFAFQPFWFYCNESMRTVYTLQHFQDRGTEWTDMNEQREPFVSAWVRAACFRWQDKQAIIIPIKRSSEHLMPPITEVCPQGNVSRLQPLGASDRRPLTPTSLSSRPKAITFVTVINRQLSDSIIIPKLPRHQ